MGTLQVIAKNRAELFFPHELKGNEVDFAA